MSNEFEEVDFTNNDEMSTEDTHESEESKEDVDWDAKYKSEFNGRLKRIETKLKKAFENPSTKPSSSDGLDFGQRAYLTTKGVSETEMDFVFEESKKAGQPINVLLQNEYFLAKLDKMRNEVRTEEATPSSATRTGQANSNDVEYWIAKGEMPPENQVELRRAYVNAKYERDQNKGKFYNQ